MARNTSTRVSSELIREDRLLRDAVLFVDYHRQASSLKLREIQGYYFGPYKEIPLKQKTKVKTRCSNIKISKNI